MIPGFQIYFFDDNAYPPEGDKTFWVKGRVAGGVPDQDRPADVAGRAHADRGPGRHRRGRDRSGGGARRVALKAGEQQRVFFNLDPGFSYQGTWPVWTASVSSSRGFVPIFYEAGSPDTRFLGVRVNPMLIQ